MDVYNLFKNIIIKMSESVSVEPSTSLPLIEGTASAGSESKYARGDHVHPRSSSSFYGTCSTAAGTAAKVVTVTGFTFDAGNILCVNFSTANTAATPTLNVNSAGAKTIYISGTTALSATTNVLKWSANTLVYFMYDGTYFRYITSVSAGSVQSSRGAGTWYGTCSTAAATIAKVGTVANFVLTVGAIISIKFTYDVPASATLNVNSTGGKSIYYQGAAINADTIKAGDTVTFIYNGTQYSIASIDHKVITNEEIDALFGAAGGTSTNAQDYIIERGTSGIWVYRKWSSGLAECWAVWGGSLTHYSTPTTGLYGYYVEMGLPAIFDSTVLPVIQVTAGVGNGFAWSGASMPASYTGTSFNAYAISTLSGTQTVTFNMSIKGRWKPW